MHSRLYAPLPSSRHIRLLHLSLSRRYSAKVRCDVQCVSLEEVPVYEAISWEWGDPKDTEAVILNNEAHNIPRNLVAALREFRRNDRPRLLWADAICVDLEIPLERADQICLMRDIYKQAVVVRVWLGPILSKNDVNIFPMFETMASGTSIRDVYRQYLTGDATDPMDPEDFADAYSVSSNLEGPKSGTQLIARLEEFFDMGWFERLWTVQEVVVAKMAMFHWGTRTIPLATLLRAHDSLIEDLRANFTSTAAVFGYAELTAYINHVQGKPGPIRHCQAFQSVPLVTDLVLQTQKAYCMLVEALIICRPQLASDPRDKLYGLLGMLPSQVALQVKTSYLRPQAEVFADVAYLVLEVTQSFILFNGILEAEKSWIPDWKHYYHYYGDFHVRVNQHLLFSAGSGMQWQISMSTDKTLHTKGIRVDEVHLCGKVFADIIDAGHASDLINDWAQLLLETISLFGNSAEYAGYAVVYSREYFPKKPPWQSMYPDGSTVVEAMSRAVLDDCVPLSKDGGLRRAQVQDWADSRAWIEYILSKEPVEFPSTRRAHAKFRTGSQGIVFQTVRGNLQGNAYFTTKCGYCGTAPETAPKPADEVWVLAGASHPVILRPVDAKNGTYRAVSEAYVQGIMDGEVASGRCPVLPRDHNTEHPRRQINEGRRSWPLPSWTDVHIL